MNRRRFISTASAGVAGLALSPDVGLRVPLWRLWRAGSCCSGTAGRDQVRRTPPGRRHVYRQRRRDWLPGEWRRCARCGQPVHGDGHDLRRRPQDARPARAPQFLINSHHHGDHTSGNKAFQGVQKILGHENCLAWHKKTTEEAKTVADQAYATATFKDVWVEDFGNEKVEVPLPRPGPHQRRCDRSLPACERRSRRRSAVPTDPSAHRQSLRRLSGATGCKTLHPSREGSQRRHHLHLRSRRRTARRAAPRLMSHSSAAT